jgi:predicted AlkP superfamily phosphohydrolase/phosphomutase
MPTVLSSAGKAPASRVLVIGLDRATFRVLDPMRKAGLMPNLQRLITTGAFGSLLSTVPPTSAAAWTTFITGKNPGKHGILQFVSQEVQPGLEEAGEVVEIAPCTFAVVNARSIKTATLWDMVGDAGQRLAVINVPMTYAPPPVNGAMITSTLNPPGAEQFIYPAELKGELQGSD